MGGGAAAPRWIRVTPSLSESFRPRSRSGPCRRWRPPRRSGAPGPRSQERAVPRTARARHWPVYGPGGHGRMAPAPPAVLTDGVGLALYCGVSVTPPYRRTAIITGVTSRTVPSHERTSGEHGRTVQAPPARAGLTPLDSRTATIAGPSLEWRVVSTAGPGSDAPTPVA